jgi:hypothetical protein
MATTAPTAPEQVTVTGTAYPCPNVFATYYANPTLLNKIRYNLCLAEHKASTFIVDAGHWAWSALQNMWTELSNLMSSIGQGIVQAGQYVGQAIASGAQQLWNSVKSFLNWLDGQLGLAENWLLDAVLLIGGLWLAIELAPAAVEIARTRRKRRE